MSFADDVVNGNYSSNKSYGNKKKKRSFADQVVMGEIDDNLSSILFPVKQTQAPVQQPEEKKQGFFDNWVKFDAFKDGYQIGDVTNTILGTGANIRENFEKGVTSNVEGVIDFGANLISGAAEGIGQKDAAKSIREWAQKDFISEQQNKGLNKVLRKFTQSDALNIVDTANTINQAIVTGDFNILNPFNKEASEKSKKLTQESTILDTKGEGVVQGVGQLAGQAMLNAAGVPWQLTAFANSAGSEMNNAFSNNANFGQALMSGIISGAVEVGSEYIGGGANKLLGMTSLGSKAIEKLGGKISNKFAARLLKIGIDAASEGFEEVVSGFGQAVGQKLTYMSDKELKELYSSDQALEEFISGAIVSAIGNAPGNIQSIQRGEQAFTGRTQNEQRVYDALLQERIDAAQEGGKKLTKKQINQIETNLESDLQKGRIGSSNIERVLGYGDRVNNLIIQTEQQLGRELNQQERQQIQQEVSQEYFNELGKDELLQRSYYEDAQSTQKLDIDVSQYKGKQQEIVQKAIDSGLLNNTTATKELVDFVSKMAADKGISFDWTNNENLKNSGFAVDGADINGYVNAKGDITLNIDASKPINSIVGHEITHVLEGSELYDSLAKAVKDYATSIGEYDEKLKKIEKLYEDVEGADAVKELTADLVGDYLFTNQEFINQLTKDRNLFEKVFDEIKYMLKQATTGSKEERELNKAKKMFEKAYRDNSVKLAAQQASTNTSDIKYSLSDDIIEQTGSKKGDAHSDFFIDRTTDFDRHQGNTPDGKSFVLRLQKGNNEAKVSLTENDSKIWIDELYVKNQKEGYGKDIVDAIKNYAYETGKTIETFKEVGSAREFWNKMFGESENEFSHKYFKGKPEYWQNKINDVQERINRFTQWKENALNDGNQKLADLHQESIDREYKWLNEYQQELDKANNNKIQYSLSTDSKGRELTTQQQEYFKDSKVRDDEGRLIELYHGTPNDFTKFNYDKLGTNGTLLGKGFYLTDDINVGEAYANKGDNGKIMKLYADIQKPLKWGEKSISKSQYKDFVEAINKETNGTLFADYSGEYSEKGSNQYNSTLNDILMDYEYGGDDIDLISGLLNSTGMSWEKAYRILKDVTGYDGIIVTKDVYDSGEGNVYIPFLPEQIKNVDNLNPTKNPDIRYSLTQNGEDIAPIGDYNVYGRDIALQEQPDIVPIKETISNIQDDIIAIRDDYKKQSEDIKKELQTLRQQREELDTGINEVAPIEENIPLNENLAPIESENTYYNENVPALTDNELKRYKNYFKSKYALKGKQLNEAMENIKELSTKPDLTRQDVYNYFKENFGKEEIKSINHSILELKSELRNTPIGITEDLKSEMNYRQGKFSDFKKKYFGKLKLVNYDGTNGLDQVYQELAETYPELLNEEEISNPADQLMQLAEITDNPGYISVFENVPEELIRGDADELYSMIQDYRNETTQSLAEQIPTDYLDNLAPVEEDTIDNYYQDLNDRISNLEHELDLIPYRERIDINNRQQEEILNDQIAPVQADILDLVRQQEERKEGNVKASTPVIAKEKSALRTGLDTLKTMFTNSNAEIDNLARESGNKNIKFAGDMLNNYAAEAQNDIEIAQTNNEGKQIGKSVSQLFEPAQSKGLLAAFNDYLINYSNIDRWARGKGSATPLEVSEKLVKSYEQEHPEFKKWAADVWKYSENVRKNWLDAGMITKNMYDTLSEAYPHYVPYISDGTNKNFDSTLDKLNELKTKAFKSAKGGATQLYPVQEALVKYTYANKRAYRTNELYKQIYNTLQTNEGQRGAEVGEGYFESGQNLYRNDSGNVLTAVIDGEERSIEISDDLFKSLRNDMETQIRDYEKRLSLITKPLQTFGNIRRNILTSWSPTFTITNPLKDIQDAFMNSKHPVKLAKNYMGAVKELFTNSTDEVKQFKALYGGANTMGQYDVDSGLYKPKTGNKNNNFLKKLMQVNEIMELAPRYAEFKSSLQSGESYQEAMYNAREVTTNFSRGGVITKALNRNGFTFLNANVQGFDKFIRNFSGENGARGIVNSLLKATLLGVVPALFNELAFGMGDDKDEDYAALPDYIKDNYYLIKLGDGNFVRIPKGRMLSVFGSAARRTLELAEGEEDAFEGFLSNANSQIGISSPEESNIFAPLIQAFGSENGENWYGGDLVPSRLQDKPKNEQYDASIDKFSIWLSNTELGKKMGLSPYKVNYVLDQYTGGVGDIVLPTITDEATSKGNLLAPVIDKFTADSTTDNKYVSDFYSKNDELKVKANSSEATDDDLLRNQFMYGISKQMSALYAERRAIQSDNSLTKAEKYEKSQAIKDQINQLAKAGLDGYNNIQRTGSYAAVGSDMSYYKNAKGNWTAIDQDDIIATESIGLNDLEKSKYYETSNDIYNINQEYKSKTANATDEQKTILNARKKKDIINAIKNSGMPDNAKAILYDKNYASTDTVNAVLNCGINFNQYLDLEAQGFTADKDKDGKTINGSKKAKVYNYINQMPMSYEKKIMLAKLYYKSDDTYNREIINYLNNDSSISYEEMKQILKAMGMKIDDYGNITW